MKALANYIVAALLADNDILEQAGGLSEAWPGFLRRKSRVALNQPNVPPENDLESALRGALTGGIVGEFDRWNHKQYQKWQAKEEKRREKLGLPPLLTGMK